MRAIWIFVLWAARYTAGSHVIRSRDIVEIVVAVRWSYDDAHCSGLVPDDGSPLVFSPPALLEFVVCGRRRGEELARERLLYARLSTESHGGRVAVHHHMISALEPGRVMLTAHYGELSSGSVPILVTE